MEETLEHVLWRCPRWAEERRGALPPGTDLSQLVCRLAPLTLHSALFPPHPALEAFAAERRAGVAALPAGPVGGEVGGPEEVVWTDGGGLWPGTPLAVASWAVFFGPDDARSGCGLVAGAQTA